jgi:ubiquinone/menaquinone biosynthesis C-methylase UbiE
MLRHLNEWVPDAIKYLIKPTSVQMKSKLENLIPLDGTYKNIPLKNDYLDLFIVIDLPSTDSLEESFCEWHRVVKKTGKMTIMTPSILINKYKVPLTIGNFIEKYEHEKLEKGEYINKKHLQELLKTHFKQIKEKEIVHITALIATGKKS